MLQTYMKTASHGHCVTKSTCHYPRGNNTNNYCEAQFLVLEDEILNRQKEANVVGLMDKFTSVFDNHYCNKLLSVVSEKYEGIYSRRF